MNLTKFISEVEQITKLYDRNQLQTVIHEIARTLPESMRNDFLRQIKECGQKKVTEKADSSSKWKKQYEKWNVYLTKIENEEVYLNEIYNDEYDEWYNSSVEEILYEDPEEIGEQLSVICQFIHQCTDASEYRLAEELGRRLLSIKIPTDGEYGGETLNLSEMIYYELMQTDLKKVVLDILYACYQIEKGKKRVEALYEIWSNARMNELRLEDLMQYAEDELESFDVFLKEWIAYLGTKNDRLAEKLFQEAVELTNDIDTKFEQAKKYADFHPGLYRNLLKEPGIDTKTALKIGKDGMIRIDKKFRVRSEVALKTAEYASECGMEKEFIENCYIEAFRSDTNAVNYLRAFINSRDREKCRQDLKNIIVNVKRVEKRSDIWCSDMSYLRADELNENIVDQNMLYILKILDGNFTETIKAGMSGKQMLGWTGSFMKQGIAIFLLCIYDGEKPDVGIKEMIRIAEQVFGFQRQNTEEPSFYDTFLQWKKETPVEETEKRKILYYLDKIMVERTDAIIEGNHRKYYEECAAYIAAIGEAKEAFGEPAAKQKDMSEYAVRYPRRTAFKGALQSFGWVKKK